MTDNQKISKLKQKLEIAKQNHENLKQIMYETQSELDELTYTPEQLHKAKMVIESNKLEKSKQEYQRKYHDLLKELNTRINLQNVQYDFVVKNEVIIKDLNKKISEQESQLKKLKNETSIHDSHSREEDGYIDKLGKINNIFSIINYIFLGILVIILLICSWKRRYG